MLNYFSYKDIWYNKEFFKAEKNFVLNLSNYIKNSLNINTEYEKLVSNLDIQSIKIINRIISRVQMVSKNIEFQKIDLFSKQEKKQIYDNYSYNKLRRYKNAIEFDRVVLPFCFNFEIWTCLYKSGLVFIKNEKYKGQDIIDIGGYIGDSALFLQKYTGGIIHAIEPDNVNYSYMKEVLNANNNILIKPYNIAIGERNCKKLFQSRGITSSFVRYPQNIDNISEVAVITLDYFVTTKKLNPYLIKIDVEGSENLVLLGSIETLKKYKPTIIVSVYHNGEEFFNLKSQIEELNIGYKIRLVKPEDGLILRKTTLIAECK